MVADTFRGFSPGKAEAWVFVDSFPKRLRFEIDRKWHGEPPRTYLYDPAHNITAYSGKPDPQTLERWIRAQFAAR